MKCSSKQWIPMSSDRLIMSAALYRPLLMSAAPHTNKFNSLQTPTHECCSSQPHIECSYSMYTPTLMRAAPYWEHECSSSQPHTNEISPIAMSAAPHSPITNECSSSQPHTECSSSQPHTNKSSPIVMSAALHSLMLKSAVPHSLILMSETPHSRTLVNAAPIIMSKTHSPFYKHASKRVGKKL